MSIEIDRSRMTVEDLALRVRSEMIPLSSRFSYFSVVPLPEEDLRQYLHDPIAAISQAICATLPRIAIVMAPYLERSNGKSAATVSFEKPVEGRQVFVARAVIDDMVLLAFGIKDEEVADYHHTFYAEIASLVADNWGADAQERFYRLLREELGAEVHGEVDDRSWHLKQALLRRQPNVRKQTKLFRDYARQAFEDTLTLYLHGTCCDIDVDTGPRQMPSRYVRKRLELLLSLYPPPAGYAVLPEQLKTR